MQARYSMPSRVSSSCASQIVMDAYLIYLKQCSANVVKGHGHILQNKAP